MAGEEKDVRADRQRLATGRAMTEAERWRQDNAEAIEAWNAHVEQHGLPLVEFRRF